MRLKKKVYVRIPASSSNFGPGYDALGLAFKLYNELTLETAKVSGHDKPGVFIIMDGEGADDF